MLSLLPMLPWRLGSAPTGCLASQTGRSRPGDIVAAAMALSPAERSLADSQLLEWHREAAGYKVRHVPATLPDLLKTKAVLRWEYASFRDINSALAIEAMQEQLAWLQSDASDYEIALPMHELSACAEGRAYYEGLDEEARHEQLRFIARICEEMYPRLRLFLFDRAPDLQRAGHGLRPATGGDLCGGILHRLP